MKVCGVATSMCESRVSHDVRTAVVRRKRPAPVGALVEILAFFFPRVSVQGANENFRYFLSPMIKPHWSEGGGWGGGSGLVAQRESIALF